MGALLLNFGVFLLWGTIRASQIQHGCASTPYRVDHLSSIIILSDEPSWWVFGPQWLTFGGYEASRLHSWIRLDRV
jgi:hypothetical protein